ncbi:hypothetical protein SLEP1_g27713 [Rubroshorea leprosula]|uniref:Retrotransposon gag domain-containing protein n=1 Tax=Rubroshorea leprosula TaxID=152421 RepID=A0AAV5K010_9ROSI|nr:hypothetical protein SLEP1_g27713 [Rubroshorea leprosula]
MNLNVGGGGDRNESQHSSIGNHDWQRINDNGRQMGQQDQPTVRELMQAFVDAMSRSKCRLIDFVKLTKPFDGSSTAPVVAEDWIDDIEKAFRGKEERILTALITLEKFKESFYRDFIPSSVRVEMQRKYFNLQQGNKTVVDYEKELYQLSKFVSPTIQGDEETKIQKFTFGLNSNVQHEVMTLCLKTSFEVVNKAKLVEQAFKLTKTGEGSGSGVKRQRWPEIQSGNKFRGLGSRQNKKQSTGFSKSRVTKS